MMAILHDYLDPDVNSTAWPSTHQPQHGILFDYVGIIIVGLACSPASTPPKCNSTPSPATLASYSVFFFIKIFF